MENVLGKYNTFQLKFMYKIPKYRTPEAFFDAFRNRRHRMYMASLKSRNSAEGMKTIFHLHPLHEEQVRRIVYKGMRLMRGVSETDWLLCMGVSHTGVNVWNSVRDAFRLGDRPQCFRRLAHLTLGDFIILNRYVSLLHERESIRTFPLPKHWRDGQRAALQGRFEGGVSTVHHVCTSCKRFKGFLSGWTTTLAFHAFGQEKIALDVMTGKKYCAQKTTRKNTRDVSTLSLTQQARDLRREDEARACSSTECKGIDMLGTLLQCYDRCYVLCPQCGRPTRFSFEKHRTSSFSCRGCHQEKPVKERVCHFCRRTCRKLSQVRVGPKEVVDLCPKHYRRRFASTTWTKQALFQQIEREQMKNLG